MVDVERSDRQRDRVMVVTDPGMSAREPVGGALEALRAEGIDAVLYDRARAPAADSRRRFRFASAPCPMPTAPHLRRPDRLGIPNRVLARNG